MAAARTQTRRRKAPAKRTSANKRKRPPARAKRSLLASRPSLHLTTQLQPHQLDVLALALIAIGVFLGGVAYAGWSGGTLGDGAVRATHFVLGWLGNAIPAVLVIGGGLMPARELRPPGRPLKTSALTLTAAIAL